MTLQYILRFLRRLRLKWPRFVYHDRLEPHVWNADSTMNKLVSNATQMLVWSYIAYVQKLGFPLGNDMVYDFFVHGSITNYYYDENSDIDICIIADLERFNALLPNVDVYRLLKSLLYSWLRYHKIKICGRGIDIEFVDVHHPKYPDRHKVGSAYSIAHDQWIIRPRKLSKQQIRIIRKQALHRFRETRRQYKKIMRDKMQSNFIETFVARLSTERRADYDANYAQPVTPVTMAFRMVRSCGMLANLHNRTSIQRSKNFNVEL